MGKLKAEYFDTLEFIIQYEQGNLSHEEVVDGFRRLIESGHINALQGSYQRTAMRLIESGEIV